MTPVLARGVRRRPRGMTVLELMVALAIVGVLAALSVAALDRANAAAKTGGAARALRDDLMLARARTVAQGTYWGICLRGSKYAGDDGAANEMTLFGKPRPNDAPSANALGAANARLNLENDPELPRDRVGDRHVIAGPAGEALELGAGVAAEGATTVMFDLIGRPWVFTGDTCDADDLTLVAGPAAPEGPGWPAEDAVQFQLRVPGRTDFQESARWLRAAQDGTFEILKENPPE